jgi:hypothetical protein
MMGLGRKRCARRTEGRSCESVRVMGFARMVGETLEVSCKIPAQ